MKLEIKDLHMKYATKVAIEKMNLELTPGIYGLLGPNGAGKSTLMNIITDNLKATSGEILYGGENIVSMGSAFRRLIGYMPQQQGMYDQFSAKRFLQYVSAIKGVPKKQAKEQIEKYLQMVGLDHVAGSRLGSFSGGMRQRIMFAATMLGEPKVFLFDEPTAGLDPEERIKIRNYISKISGDSIVILATHVVSDVECIADKIILMNGGNIIKNETPHELIRGVEDKVFEMKCTTEDIERLNDTYKKGNIRQGKDGLYFRVVADEKPEGFETIKGEANLEDVYLYYF
ncbi:MAG: ATP-binding cassette domain-containing protein [Lachnospiraceae bacterium]|nr:ATP-binding cassette domain-containing protein [Lachnospiraceae bacterium]